jgi:hypothetical protein
MPNGTTIKMDLIKMKNAIATAINDAGSSRSLCHNIRVAPRKNAMADRHQVGCLHKSPASGGLRYCSIRRHEVRRQTKERVKTRWNKKWLQI